jgi:hypothetical protein
LSNILIKEFCRDEAPKAPVLLYALESAQIFSQKEEIQKYDLEQVSRSLWLGELSPEANLVIPFDEQNISLGGKNLRALFKKFTGNSNAISGKSLFHRSALQALVMHQITSRMYKPSSNEQMRDSNGAINNSMSSLIKNIIYSEKPNIVLPQLQLPL